MNSAHGDEHRAILSELVASADDPRASWRASPVAHCVECGAELDELLSARAQLETAGSGVRSTLEAAARMRGSPGEERSAATLRQLLTNAADSRARETPPPASKTRWRTWLALAAAAALVVVVWRWRTGGDPRDSQSLGPGRLTAVEPVGDVHRWSAFRWSGTLPERGWFVVRARGATPDGREWKEESAHLREPQWTPASTEGWPRAIEWEVHSYSSSGEPFDSCSARASLSD